MYKTDDPKSDNKTYKPNDSVGQLKLSIAINLIPKLRPVPCQDYRIIVLDPPWDFHLRETDPSHRGRCPYPSMTDQQIKDRPIGAITNRDSYLLLWVTNLHQALGVECMKKWGFTHKSTFTWEKVSKDGRPHAGIGHYGRSCTEHFLVATKGNPGSFTHHGLTNIINIIRAPRTKHSQKPEQFWEIADRLAQKLENCQRLGKLSQPSRIELFSRTPRPNWDTWGAEAE